MFLSLFYFFVSFAYPQYLQIRFLIFLSLHPLYPGHLSPYPHFKSFKLVLLSVSNNPCFPTCNNTQHTLHKALNLSFSETQLHITATRFPLPLLFSSLHHSPQISPVLNNLLYFSFLFFHYLVFFKYEPLSASAYTIDTTLVVFLVQNLCLFVLNSCLMACTRRKYSQQTQLLHNS